MQGQGTQCHTWIQAISTYLPPYQDQTSEETKNQNCTLETMVQRVLLIVTITLENYEVIYTTYSQKIME